MILGLIFLAFAIWVFYVINFCEKKSVNEYVYGTKEGTLARINKSNGDAEFILWRGGEQGHKIDFWHRFGSGHKQLFISGYPTELQKSDRLEF